MKFCDAYLFQEYLLPANYYNHTIHFSDTIVLHRYMCIIVMPYHYQYGGGFNARSRFNVNIIQTSYRLSIEGALIIVDQHYLGKPRIYSNFKYISKHSLFGPTMLVHMENSNKISEYSYIRPLCRESLSTAMQDFNGLWQSVLHAWSEIIQHPTTAPSEIIRQLLRHNKEISIRTKRVCEPYWI